MNQKISIGFGFVSPPLCDQLNKHQLFFDETTIKHFELDRDALNRMRMRELIPESQTRKAYEKLSERIFEHIQEQYSLHVEDIQ